ncbi:hypothetical protein LEMLEM_LOCUS16233 [Lemmus lemmus]
MFLRGKSLALCCTEEENSSHSEPGSRLTPSGWLAEEGLMPRKQAQSFVVFWTARLPLRRAILRLEPYKTLNVSVLTQLEEASQPWKRSSHVQDRADALRVSLPNVGASPPVDIVVWLGDLNYGEAHLPPPSPTPLSPLNCGFLGDGATWGKTAEGWCLATRNLLTKPSVARHPCLGSEHCSVQGGASEVIIHSSLWAARVGELSECGVGTDSWTQPVHNKFQYQDTAH